jgi:ubiquinone/menaquinone biosynthesis C-methylase UbiE
MIMLKQIPVPRASRGIAMPPVLQFGRLFLEQMAGRQVLERRPEPSQLTDAAENVTQYDQVMGTKLVLAYAVGLTTIHRARGERTASAADIACGPGHFTLCLARHLGYERITGVDLAEPMVAIAHQNAAKQNLTGRVRFAVGDATQLPLEDAQLDLACFTDAAHHMPDLQTVSKVLRELDRVTRPDGLVMVMDLVRLRTAAVTERYVNVLGSDYVQRGLPQFLDDFRNSMYAAWTADELRSAVPGDTGRTWWHIVPRGLPSTQILLGLPPGRDRIFLRGGVPWTKADSPIPAEMRFEWRLLQATMKTASRMRLPAPLLPGRRIRAGSGLSISGRPRQKDESRVGRDTPCDDFSRRSSLIDSLIERQDSSLSHGTKRTYVDHAIVSRFGRFSFAHLGPPGTRVALAMSGFNLHHDVSFLKAMPLCGNL